MKTIEVDEELYRYIASHTQHIGESASEILRRMLNLAPAVSENNEQVITDQETQQVMTSSAIMTAQNVAVTSGDRIHRIRSLLDSAEFKGQKKVVDRFLLLLSTLYLMDKDGFAEATESLHGRTRIYFSHSKDQLLKSGRHTKPKSIPQTPYWVITNTNTGRKRSMIEHIMSTMQFPAELTEEMCLTIQPLS
ncbi:MAG: replication initiation negative regulator SeqA [Enterobacteriaceae bacterium]|jgi:negative modulator of initiation of replication|nr:replication initiation negative regulator SeqA [Enterobacteriaceae bacterium]